MRKSIPWLLLALALLWNLAESQLNGFKSGTKAAAFPLAPHDLLDVARGVAEWMRG
jgi:hypothetical protein